MKALITILGVSSICLSNLSYARIVVGTGDGRSAYTTSETYFVQAADLTIPINLSEKITTPSGAIVERIDDPKRGLMLKDPNGLLWSSTLMVDRPQMSIFNKPQISAEDVYPGHVSYYCGKIGARPPTLTEYKNLAKLFLNKDNKYDSQSAKSILEPGANRFGYPYLTNINMADPDYGFYSSIFDLFDTGSPIEGNSGNLLYDGMTKDRGGVKCVVSPDMVFPIDTKKQYDSLAMPIMKSCDPEQFFGRWSAEKVICSNPDDTSAVLSHPEKVLFTIGGARNASEILRLRKNSSFKSAEMASVNGFRGAAGNEKRYPFNSDMFTDGAGGNEYTDHIISRRKDGKGCDVFKVGVTSYTRGNGYKTIAPDYLFTIGKNQADGSIILQSNGNSQSFCHERTRNQKILQVLQLKSVN